MPDSLFTYPARLPEVPREIAMYRTAPEVSYSRKKAADKNEFLDRVKRYSTLFKASSPPLETGNFALFREPEHTLEIFRLSKSLRWTHNTLAYRESVPREKLPQEEEARKLAEKALRDFQLESPHAAFKSIAYSQLAVSTSPGATGKVQNTEIHVINGFSLDGLPVFGPGAKQRASFVEEGRMSRLLSFWREPVKDKPRRIKTPQEALDRFAQDPRFMRLSPETAVVTIHDIALGYYALSPSEYQRYLIPVYAVTGMVRTAEFPRYDFTHYIVAVDINAEELKRAAAVANPGSCSVF